MSRTEYAITVRARYNKGIEVRESWTAQAVAENRAQAMYKEEGLDMVAVIENEGMGRRNVVMKIQRTCRHFNLQRELFVNEWRCVECGEVVRILPQTLSSIVEDSPQAQTTTGVIDEPIPC